MDQLFLSQSGMVSSLLCGTAGRSSKVKQLQVNIKYSPYKTVTFQRCNFLLLLLLENLKIQLKCMLNQTALYNSVQ